MKFFHCRLFMPVHIIFVAFCSIQEPNLGYKAAAVHWPGLEAWNVRDPRFRKVGRTEEFRQAENHGNPWKIIEN